MRRLLKARGGDNQGCRCEGLEGGAKCGHKTAQKEKGSTFRVLLVQQQRASRKVVSCQKGWKAARPGFKGGKVAKERYRPSHERSAPT